MKYAMYIGASEDQVRWGGNDDPRDLLTMGETYAVKDVEVHSWHTMYILCDFPGKKFNSVSFKDVVPSKVAQPTTAKLIKEFSDRITAMKKHGKPSDAALIAKNVPLYESTIAYLQDIDRLQSELEACRRDADRYRWLVRNRHGWFYHMLSYHPMKPANKETYDEAIDAALAAAKETEDD